ASDPVEAIKALTDGNGADVVIEAVGRPETWKQAFLARDLAGTVVQVGVPSPDMTVELPLIELFGRGGALKSSWYGDCLPSRDFPMLIDLYLRGKLDLDGFVSETIGIEQVEDAFEKMERGEVLRSVVVFYPASLARSTVTAWPAIFTRSPATRTRKTPPRADTCRAISSSLPRRPAHKGASVQWAEPVAGSSGMPSLGPKTRSA